MRIAVFSDVHGNIFALQTVLADIDANQPVDHIVFAGDLCAASVHPAECIAALQERDIPGVYGNADLWLWEPPNIPKDAAQKQRDFWMGLFKRYDWINERIGAEGLAYLQALPFELRFAPNDNPEDELLVVHANPLDVVTPIFPPENVQQEMKGKIEQPDDDVKPLLEGVTAKTIAFGHVHVPNVRQIGDHALFNISSVSQPQDGDWRAKYAILEFSENGWRLTRHFVEYDLDAEREAILKSGAPGAEISAARLPSRQGMLSAKLAE